MPPTVMTPWLTPCDGLDEELGLPLPPPECEPDPEPEEEKLPPLPLPPPEELGSVVPPPPKEGGPPLGVPALVVAYVWPSTPPACTEAAPRWVKAYATAPPRPTVATTLNVRNTMATRSFMSPLLAGR